MRCQCKSMLRVTRATCRRCSKAMRRLAAESRRRAFVVNTRKK